MAFDSYPPGAPHDRITREACRRVSWPEHAAHELIPAVRHPDREESKWAPSWSPRTWLRFHPNHRYDPSHHSDRAPGVRDADAALRAIRYARACLESSTVAFDVPDRRTGMRWLGRALHVGQDFCSHSNLVDLPPASQDSAMAWFGASEPTLPVALRITGYDPAARDPEMPPGDDYPHRLDSKDNAHKNSVAEGRIGGETRFEIAVRLAVTLSVRILRRVEAASPGLRSELQSRPS